MFAREGASKALEWWGLLTPPIRRNDFKSCLVGASPLVSRELTTTVSGKLYSHRLGDAGLRANLPQTVDRARRSESGEPEVVCD